MGDGSALATAAQELRDFSTLSDARSNQPLNLFGRSPTNEPGWFWADLFDGHTTIVLEPQRPPAYLPPDLKGEGPGLGAQARAAVVTVHQARFDPVDRAPVSMVVVGGELLIGASPAYPASVTMVFHFRYTSIVRAHGAYRCAAISRTAEVLGD